MITELMLLAEAAVAADLGFYVRPDPGTPETPWVAGVMDGSGMADLAHAATVAEAAVEASRQVAEAVAARAPRDVPPEPAP